MRIQTFKSQPCATPAKMRPKDTTGKGQRTGQIGPSAASCSSLGEAAEVEQRRPWSSKQKQESVRKRIGYKNVIPYQRFGGACQSGTVGEHQNADAQVWTGGLESNLRVFNLYRVMVFQGQLTVLWLSSARCGSALMLFSMVWR